MSQQEDSLASKGFVFQNPKLKGKTRHKEKKHTDDLICGQYVPEDKVAYENYKRCFKTFETCLKSLQDEVFSDAVKKILKFTHASLIRENDWYKDEIPTAVVVTGVNVPDHEVMFSIIKESFSLEFSCFISTLTSHNCSSLKSMIRCVVHQLITCDGSDLPSGGKEISYDSEDEAMVLGKSKPSDFNFLYLKQWYKNLSSQRHEVSPKKKKRTSANVDVKPCVIILKDFHHMDPMILRDFILISHLYHQEIPFLFIFCIPSYGRTVNSLLDFRSLSKLSLETVNTVSPAAYLGLVIEKLFLENPANFKFSSRVLQLLVDVYLYQDFSINGIMKAIKFSLLEHLMGSLAGKFCGDASYDDEIMCLEERDISDIKLLPSVSKVLESKDVDTDTLQEMIVLWMSDLKYHHDNLVLMCRILNVWTSGLPGSPLGRQVREVYCWALSGNLEQSDEYEECFKLIGMMALQQLQERLQESIAVVHKYQNDNCKESSDKFLSLFFGVTEKLKAVSYVKGTTSEPVQFSSAGKMSCQEIQKELLETLKAKKKKNPLESIRTDLISSMKNLIQTYLLNPCDLPLNELYYFDDPVLIKQMLLPRQRKVMLDGLSNPQFYFKCDCCSKDHISATMPDICIMYRLYKEAGRFINLHDWLVAFIGVFQPDFDPLSDEPINENLHSRFVQALKELQFLGFIRPTKRKVDHVENLMLVDF